MRLGTFLLPVHAPLVSGGAVFSSCTTYIGDSEFFNNSVVWDGVSPSISGSALRVAQVSRGVKSTITYWQECDNTGECQCMPTNRLPPPPPGHCSPWQVDSNLYFVNSTVFSTSGGRPPSHTLKTSLPPRAGNGIAGGGVMLPAVSLSATAGATSTILGNLTFGDNVGGGISFTTDPISSPSFAFQVSLRAPVSLPDGA